MGYNGQGEDYQTSTHQTGFSEYKVGMYSSSPNTGPPYPNNYVIIMTMILRTTRTKMIVIMAALYNDLPLQDAKRGKTRCFYILRTGPRVSDSDCDSIDVGCRHKPWHNT